MLNGGVYFHYVEGNRTRDEQYWQHHFTDRSIESWEGFAHVMNSTGSTTLLTAV